MYIHVYCTRKDCRPNLAYECMNVDDKRATWYSMLQHAAATATWYICILHCTCYASKYGCNETCTFAKNAGAG